MSILESARELASAIENSPELRKVKEAELRLMLDIEARELVESFQNIQMEAVNNGVNYEDLPDDTKKQLEDLENKMNENEIIKDYMTKNQELNQVLEAVNMMITSALSDNSQGSGCSSCSSSCDDGSCCSSCGM